MSSDVEIKKAADRLRKAQKDSEPILLMVIQMQMGFQGHVF